MKSSDNSKPKVLILGATGLLGRLALEAYRSSHFVHATARKNPLFPLGNNITFTEVDLGKIPLKLDWPQFDQIVVCSGTGGQAFCESEPEISRQINVDGVTEVLSRYAKPETNIVICSSDIAQENGASEYARQKYDLEKFVRAKFPRHAILRFGKVLDRNGFIGVAWQKQVSEKIPLQIRPEIFFSPVLQSRASKIFDQTAQRGLQGTLLVSANDEWSYLTLAQWLQGEAVEPFLSDAKFSRPRRQKELFADAISTKETLEQFFSKTGP